MSEGAAGRIPWGRLVAEALLVFGSVYLAIALESRTQDRREAREAHEALGQLLLEIREDQRDLGEIRGAQVEMDARYRSVLRWLEDPDGLPGDSMTANLTFLSLNNRTMFPRKASWNTMVAAGQLPDLEDPGLVTRLGNLYENVVPRLEYNGRYYDEDVSVVYTQIIPGTWDSATDGFTPDGVREAVRLREALLRIHLGWTLYYIDLLDGYGELLEVAAGAVEAYLVDHGIERAQGRP